MSVGRLFRVVNLIAVAAMTADRIVANESGVPWDHPEDVRQYRRRVAEDPVVVGRTTYESMRPDPPGRRHVVLSRSSPTYPEGTVTVAESVGAALEGLAASGDERAYVIGGAQVYDAFLPHYTGMALTVVEDEVAETDGTKRFPEWDRDDWTLTRTDEGYEGFRVDYWTRTDEDPESVWGRDSGEGH